MVDPIAVGAVVVVAIAAVGAYAAYSGGEGSVEVDADSDGEPELTVDFGTRSLTDVKGVGETRAVALVNAGFGTVEDVYRASDEELEAVDGIGAYTVEQIRSDIGQA